MVRGAVFGIILLLVCLVFLSACTQKPVQEQELAQESETAQEEPTVFTCVRDVVCAKIADDENSAKCLNSTSTAQLEEWMKKLPAGSAGECVGVEIYPGYKTCVMSEPQSIPQSITQIEKNCKKNLS